MKCWICYRWNSYITLNIVPLNDNMDSLIKENYIKEKYMKIKRTYLNSQHCVKLVNNNWRKKFTWSNGNVFELFQWEALYKYLLLWLLWWLLLLLVVVVLLTSITMHVVPKIHFLKIFFNILKCLLHKFYGTLKREIWWEGLTH